jgi:hypothetical protein
MDQQLNTGCNDQFEGSWQNSNNKILVKLSLIFFEEDDNKVVFCPALDLSGYGKTEQAAIESFKTTVDEYFHYTSNKKSLYSDLEAHGWTIPKHKKQQITPPEMSTLLVSNIEFSRVFNHFPFRKIDQEFAIPA